MPPVNLTPQAFAGLELVAVVAFLAPLVLDLLATATDEPPSPLGTLPRLGALTLRRERSPAST